MAEEVLIVEPDPKRIVEGLRDTGYEFPTAIADIVDNSIAAGANAVDLEVLMDLGGAIRISIADDGCGMNRDDLLNAMRYGSRKRVDPSSLGKFGLGLKTASTAFSRRLSVSSRSEPGAAGMTATWDLDHIAKTDQWELLLSDIDREALKHLEKVASGRPCTVVVWDQVDRLLPKYENSAGKAAQKAFQKKADVLREHLGMVYQRFLDPRDERARKLRITLNGKNIESWDPFAQGESELIASQTVPTELPDGTQAEFVVRAFVLPRKEEFTDPARAVVARLTNDRQGIYIYRENRLIHDADWLGMFIKEPHSTLARIEFSFTHTLDSAFHIDLKKSQILLNEVLWIFLKDTFLPPVRRAAEQRYRKGQRKQIGKMVAGAHDSSNASIADKAEELDTTTIKVINPETGDVEVSNAQGQTRLKLKVGSANKPGEVYVQPVVSIDDGLLWEPALIDGKKAVRINIGHPYYHKVYVPNLASGVTIQGMDSLLWALSIAELTCISDSTKRHFADLRFEVAKLLRRLVEDLPEPGDNSDEA